MASTSFPNYCLEYMVTGVHSQIKFADCIICSKEKYFKEFEQEQEKLKEQEMQDKDFPKDEDYDDAFDNLIEAAQDNEEVEVGESEMARLQRENEEFMSKLEKVQKSLIINTVRAFEKESGVEFILDNTMGQIVNPNKISESRFAIASLCLSQALEKIKATQFYNILTTVENEWLSSEGLVQTSKVSISEADNFLLDLNLHGQKHRIIDTLVDRIKNSSDATTAIVVFTDFISQNYAPYKSLIQQALQSRQHPISIHIVSFNLVGVDSKEDKLLSFEFFRSIAQLTKGSFSGILSLDDEVKQELFQ